MSDRVLFFHNQFSGRLAPSLSLETLFEHFDHGGLWAKGTGLVVRKLFPKFVRVETIINDQIARRRRRRC
jgi:hypothetical protein